MSKGTADMSISNKFKIVNILPVIIIAIFTTVNYHLAGAPIGLGELVFYDTSNYQISKSPIYTIKADDSGKIWAGSWGSGLCVFDGTAWKVFTTKNSGLPSDTIFKIAFDNKSNVWIGTQSGLVKYDGATWTVFTPRNSPMEVFPVMAIAIDRQNNVWFSNGDVVKGGLMVFNGNEWKLFTTENSVLPCRAINDILIDTGNAVWVGTAQFQGNGGLVRIEGDSWTKYDSSNTIMPHNSLEELSLDKEGKIWAGQYAPFYSSDTLDGALMAITHDGKTWSINNPSQTGKATKRIRAIACDKRGYMWVSTSVDLNIDYAISIFNKKNWITFTLSKDDTSRPYFVPDITIDINNNVWFAIGNGIVMLKQDTTAIDALFAQTTTKREFRLILKQKKEMVNYDILGRKSSIKGENTKKTNGILIGTDNLRAKKILNVK
jgi:ligand-binding sensor domain-containing protein